MHLCSLKVSNYRVIREACFELPEVVIAIVGPNGAGKSSLVEAVAWALYGNQAVRSGKDEIKSQFAGASDTCEVTVEFESNREHYRIARRLVGAQLRPEATIWRDGTVEAVGSSECEQAVIRILGLDLKGFQTSFLAQQNELNALAALAPAKRKEQLATMLGVDRIDRALTRLKQDQKGLSMVIESLEHQAGTRDEIAARIKSTREHIDKLLIQQARADGARNAAKSTLDNSLSSLREHEEKKGKCSLIAAQVEAEHRTVQGLASRLQSLKEKLAKLDDAAGRMAQLDIRLAGLTDLEKRHERLQKERVVATRSADLGRQKAALENDLAAIRKRQAEQTSELNELQKRSTSIPADIETRASVLAKQLESAREQNTSIRSELAVLSDHLKKSLAQFDNLLKIGPDTVCDRCHRPFGADLPSIREHLETEVKAVQSQLAQKKSALEVSTTDGLSIRKEFDAASQLLERRKETATLTAGLERLITECADRARVAQEKLQAIEKEKAQLGTVTFDEKVWLDLDRQVKELRQSANERERYAGELSHRPAVVSELESVNTQLAKSQAGIKELELQLAAIGFDRSTYETVQRDVAAAQQSFEKSRDDLVAAEKEIEVARAELQKDVEYSASLDAAANDLESKRDDLFYQAGLGRLLGEYRTFVIGRIRPRLGELAGELMAEMTAGRYSLAALDEEYNLQLWDGGAYFGVDRFSGGEKDLASLCLRLAISEALSEAAGLGQSFVILDEVFGSQDDRRKELILSALTGLKHRFPQMLLITHVEDIKDRVEHLIQVTPTGQGWSEVQVNGLVAK